MSGFIPLAIEIAKIALAAVILWFVCEWLPMPEAGKRICQLLIALIAILTVLNIVVVGPITRSTATPSEQLRVPDIIKPERK